MKVQHGGFEFRYDKKEKNNMNTQENNIRTLPKVDPKATDDDLGKFVRGSQALIKTYFAWKIADRIIEKILR